MNEFDLMQELPSYLEDKIDGVTSDDNTLIIGINNKIIRIEDYPKKDLERIISEILQQLKETNEV